MHPKWLDVLCCPRTGEALTLEVREAGSNDTIVSGVLAAGARRYPIVRGVPRFVDEQAYASSFGYEWQRWPRVQFEANNVGRPMQGHTSRMCRAASAEPAFG